MFTKSNVFVKILIDHKNLEYFMFTKQLNRRQSRWAQFLTDFHFIISYLLEKFNEKADFLIKRANDVSDKEDDRQTQQNQILLSFERFDKDLQAVEIIVVFESNRLPLMQKVHEQSASSHSEMNKTIRLLRRNHRWSEMIRDVKQYIRNCHTCRRVKTARDKYQRLLSSLSMLERSWIDITLDFVTSLLDSREYNVILMMIDRLSKMHHYISCTTDENETTAKKTDKLLIRHVWKLHELLITMISDRDSQFISLIWDTICKMLKIKVKLFIAFHSETNEQSEIFNQKMKRYLRAYVNHQQNDWTDWLSMTEYVSNVFISITTQIFSFLANYDFESRMSFDSVQFDENTVRKRIHRFKKRDIVFTMKNIWKFARDHMKKSQRQQTTHVNAHKTQAFDYQIDDQVWLFIKNIQIDRFSKKLNHKMLESFKILEKRERSYKLDLSDEMNIHSVFHISLLRKNSDDSLSRQIMLSSSSVMIDDEQKYDVEDIVNSRVIDRTLNKRLQYKMRWVKHSSDRKWYSVENFDHARKIVVDYHQRYLDKSKSHSLIIQSLFISLMTHFINPFSWAQKSIQKTKDMIENILNKMKKEMKFIIIKQTSTFSVERNNINMKTTSQDCLVTKTTSVERILSNQNWEKDNVTISCQSSNQMISTKEINKRE